MILMTKWVLDLDSRSESTDPCEANRPAHCESLREPDAEVLPDAVGNLGGTGDDGYSEADGGETDILRDGGWLVEFPWSGRTTMPLTGRTTKDIQLLTKSFRLQTLISFCVF